MKDANLALAQLSGVWFGLEPLLRYAPLPLFKTDLEASIGTPVISTNANAGASEIVLNGKGGDLIKLGDYKDLAKKIINHFNSPSKLQMKTKIAKNNLFRFETKRHSKIYTNLFKKI